MHRSRLAFLLILPLLVCLFSSCALKKLAVNMLATALSKEGGSSTFSTDDDPELIEEALPFSIKLYETLLAQSPTNQPLLLATGKAVCSYANAFVQGPAERLPPNDLNQKATDLMRAKRLYLRGRSYVLQALDLRRRGFAELVERNQIDSALALTSLRDTSYVFWLGASWMGALTADKGDVGLIVDMPKAAACFQRVLALRESYGRGAVHEILISYYGGLPVSMGGSAEKARKHFARAMELNGGTKAGPYVALATSVCVSKTKDPAEFRDLLDKAIAIDVDAYPRYRLENIMAQRKAAWLLDHIEDYFLLPETSDSTKNP